MCCFCLTISGYQASRQPDQRSQGAFEKSPQKCQLLSASGPRSCVLLVWSIDAAIRQSQHDGYERKRKHGPCQKRLKFTLEVGQPVMVLACASVRQDIGGHLLEGAHGIHHQKTCGWQKSTSVIQKHKRRLATVWHQKKVVVGSNLSRSSSLNINTNL